MNSSLNGMDQSSATQNFFVESCYHGNRRDQHVKQPVSVIATSKQSHRHMDDGDIPLSHTVYNRC